MNVNVKYVPEKQWDVTINNFEILRSKFSRKVPDYPGFIVTAEPNDNRLRFTVTPYSKDDPNVSDFPLDWSVTFFGADSTVNAKEKPGASLKNVLYDFMLPGDAGEQTLEVDSRNVGFPRKTKKGDTERAICIQLKFVSTVASRFPAWILDERGAIRTSFINSTNLRGCAISGRAKLGSHIFRVGAFGMSPEFFQLQLMQKTKKTDNTPSAWKKSTFHPHIQIQSETGEVLFRINALGETSWMIPQDYIDEKCPTGTIVLYVDPALPQLPFSGTLYKRKTVIPKFLSIIGMACTEVVDLPDAPTITPQGSEGFVLEVGQRTWPFGNVSILGQLRGLTLLNATLSFHLSLASESAAIHTHTVPLVNEKFLMLSDDGKRVIDYSPYIALKQQGVTYAPQLPWWTLDLTPKIPIEAEGLMKGVTQQEMYLFCDLSTLPPFSFIKADHISLDNSTSSQIDRACTLQSSIQYSHVHHSHGRLKVTVDAVWFDICKGVEILVERNQEWLRRDFLVKLELVPTTALVVYDLGLISNPTEEARWKLPTTARCALRIQDGTGQTIFDRVLSGPTTPNTYKFILQLDTVLKSEATYPLRFILCFGEIEKFAQRKTMRSHSLVQVPTANSAFDDDDVDDETLWCADSLDADNMSAEGILQLGDDELSKKLKEFLEKANLVESSVKIVNERTTQEIEQACAVQSSGKSKKSSVDAAALTTPDVMAKTADGLVKLYKEKQGDLLDELCANLNVPLPVLMVSITATHNAFSSKYPNIPASVLFVMVLYTCESIDIDRKLGFPNVPPPMRPPIPENATYNTLAKTRADVYVARSECIYRVVNTALRNGYDETNIVNTSTLKKWCKFIVTLMVASSPLPGRIREKPLYRGLNGLKEPLISALDALQVEDKICWPAASSCSQNEVASKEFAKNGGHMFTIVEPIEGIPLQNCSQYPEEEEVLIPPFSMFSIVSNENNGHSIEMQSVGSFVTRGPIAGIDNAKKKAFRTFLIDVRKDAEKCDQRLKQLHQIMQMMLEQQLRADVSLRTLEAHKERAVYGVTTIGENLISLGSAIYDDKQWEIRYWKILKEGKYQCTRVIVPEGDLAKHAVWCIHASVLGVGVGRDDGCAILWPASNRRTPTQLGANLVNYKLLRPEKAASDASCVFCTQKYVCCGDMKGTVRVWDGTTSKIVKTLTLSTATIRCIQHEQHMMQMYCGCEDRTIYVVNIATWEVTHRLVAHSMAVTCLTFLHVSDQENFLFSGGNDREIRAWRVEPSGEFTVGAPLKGHTDHVKSLLIVNGYLVSTSRDKSVRFWDVMVDSANLKTLRGHEEHIMCATMYNGFIATGSREGLIKLWSPITREDKARGFDIEVMRNILQFHYDDKFIVQLHQLLRAYDTNTDGSLNRQELTELYESLYARMSIEHPGSRKIQSEVLDDFRHWDKDRDNRLDLQEICAMLLQSKFSMRVSIMLK
eukprot:PhF_6_TR31833/c0_g1_i1/m.47089